MSIDPVAAIRPAPDSAAAGTVVRDRGASPDPRPVSRPDSGTRLIQESHSAKLSAPPPEMLQDEVQVQRTNDGRGDIVIRYVDPHGNLILQIPSSQLLGLARAIDHALEEQASQKSNASGDSQPNAGGESDGY